MYQPPASATLADLVAAVAAFRDARDCKYTELGEG
jgi:hypothetical protein